MRRRNDWLVLGLLLIPLRASAQPCVEITLPNGRAAYQLLGSSATSSRWAEIEEEHCRKCGGTWEFTPDMVLPDGTRVTNWCSRTPGASSTGGTDLRAVGLAIDQYVQTGTVDQFTAGMAGFQLGVAFHESMKRNAAIAAEKRRLEEQRRVEEERRRREQELRERDARFARLTPLMKMSTDANVELKLDGVDRELRMKFDGADGSLSDPSNRELMLKDRTTCVFSDCREKYEMPDDVWAVPYVDVRHIRRAVGLARAVRYAPADPAWSDVVGVAQGREPPIHIDDGAVVLPANALDLMREAAVRHKIATDARLGATAALDESISRRDLARAARESLQRNPPPGATEADRKALIVGVDRMLKAFEADVNARTRDLADARRREASTIDRERGYLQTFAARCHEGPVEYCEDRDAQISAVRVQGGARQQVIASTEERLREAERHAAKHHAANSKLLREGPAKEIAKQIEDASKRHLSALKAVQLADDGTIPADTKKRLASAAVAMNEVADAVGKFRKYAEAVVDFKNEVHEKNLRESWDALLVAMEKLDQAEWFSDLAQLGLKLYAKRVAGGNELLADLISDALTTAYRIVELSVRMNVEVASAVSWRWSAEDERRLLDQMKEADRWMRSTVDERASRVAEIRRLGGCIAAPKCPTGAGDFSGISGRHVDAFKEYAATTGRTIVVRAPNVVSRSYHGKPGYRPKPSWLKEHTSSVDGLVHVDVLPADCRGCSIDGGRLKIDGDFVYGDYDLQGMYEPSKNPKKKNRVNTNDPRELEDLNERLEPCAADEKRMLQHGANDDFDVNGEMLRAPSAGETFVIFEPRCSAPTSKDLRGLESYYLNGGMHWPYKNP